MRTTLLVLLIAIILVGWEFSTAVPAAIKTLETTSNDDLDTAVDSPYRYLKANNNEIDTTTAQDEERIEIPGLADKLEHVVKKSASVKNLKSISAMKAEVTKLETLVEMSPDLRKVKSLIGTNPEHLTKDQLKSMVSFVEKNPQKGPTIVKLLLGSSALALIITIVGSIIYGVTRTSN